MSNTVIRVEHLSKSYQYGAISHGTLTKDLQSWWARARGKDDPNAILTHSARSGQSGQRFWALQDVSFDVKQGEIVGIIGRNGAGKSTLLKILSEITTPTEGCVKLKGRVGSLLEVGTGFHPELTGRENIFLNGAILGMTKAEIRKKFDEIVAFAEIEEFLDTPVKRYSSGMYVRLAFAVAAHLEPEILLVDEVLAVGDTQFQKKCLGKMEDVAQEGRTVLFVSHNMIAIQNLCQWAILLEHGSLCSQDQTDLVLKKYLSSTDSLSCIPLNERKDRKGSGEIYFTAVEFYSHGITSNLRFCTGEDAVFIIFFKNNRQRDLRNLHIAVGIDNHMGQRITLLSNDITNEIFEYVAQATNRVEIHIQRLPLIPGKYGFTLYATVEGMIADWIQNAGFFYVEAGDYYKTGKMQPAEQGNFLCAYHFNISNC